MMSFFVGEFGACVVLVLWREWFGRWMGWVGLLLCKYMEGSVSWL